MILGDDKEVAMLRVALAALFYSARLMGGKVGPSKTDREEQMGTAFDDAAVFVGMAEKRVAEGKGNGRD